MGRIEQPLTGQPATLQTGTPPVSVPVAQIATARRAFGEMCLGYEILLLADSAGTALELCADLHRAGLRLRQVTLQDDHRLRLCLDDDAAVAPDTFAQLLAAHPGVHLQSWDIHLDRRAEVCGASRTAD